MSVTWYVVEPSSRIKGAIAAFVGIFILYFLFTAFSDQRPHLFDWLNDVTPLFAVLLILMLLIQVWGYYRQPPRIGVDSKSIYFDRSMFNNRQNIISFDRSQLTSIAVVFSTGAPTERFSRSFRTSYPVVLEFEKERGIRRRVKFWISNEMNDYKDLATTLSAIPGVQPKKEWYVSKYRTALKSVDQKEFLSALNDQRFPESVWEPEDDR